jgi:hypothetical protein
MNIHLCPLVVERHRGGHDVCALRVNYPPGYSIAARHFATDLSENHPRDALMGVDVWTLGYPRSGIRRLPEGRIIGRTVPRMFKGNILRTFVDAEISKSNLFELSFPAYEGLSGAPLFNWDDHVIGMIAGNWLEENQAQDGQRFSSAFGIAISYKSMLTLRFGLLGNQTIEEYLKANHAKK